MICHRFKGGIGTASRVLPAEAGGYTVGVLVQCNYGSRDALRVAGVPVGAEMADLLPCRTTDAGDPSGMPPMCRGASGGAATTTATWDRSSSSWRPTRHCCRTS